MPTPTELTNRLTSDLQNQGVFIDSISGMVSPYNPAVVQVSPANLQAAAQPFINAFDGSQAAQDAWTQRVTEYQSRTLPYMASPDQDSRAYRAIAAIMVDEINTLREWIMSFQAAVAAASSLANLQTRVAALPNLPDRTLAQARSAFIARVNSGT